jgi:hypothetical protein
MLTNEVFKSFFVTTRLNKRCGFPTSYEFAQSLGDDSNSDLSVGISRLWEGMLSAENGLKKQIRKARSSKEAGQLKRQLSVLEENMFVLKALREYFLVQVGLARKLTRI